MANTHAVSDRCTLTVLSVTCGAVRKRTHVSEAALGGRGRHRGRRRRKNLSIKHGRGSSLAAFGRGSRPVHGIGRRSVAVPVHECRWWGGEEDSDSVLVGCRRFEDRVVLLACVGTGARCLMPWVVGGRSWLSGWGPLALYIITPAKHPLSRK
jgi:hypothetical protein